jgi:hypothetical protein
VGTFTFVTGEGGGGSGASSTLVTGESVVAGESVVVTRRKRVPEEVTVERVTSLLDISRGVSRMNSGANSSASSLRKSSSYCSRQTGGVEQAVVVWFICILVLFWAMVKIFVFFVRMGLRHGLRSRHNIR